MRLEAKKYLYDMRQAAALLAQFTAGRSFADYGRDAMLRAAVGRDALAGSTPVVAKSGPRDLG